MGFSRCQLPLLVLSTVLTSSVQVLAQDQAASQESPGKATNRRVPRRDQKLARELGSAYDSWLKEEVADIITDEERRAFGQLATNEEREQFVESFWDRRNPDPESAGNPYKEEHYRRLAYADERFSSGVPGRKTDRGHIYILWGPPDEVESHPTGGTYDRPMEQGGGSTTTYPWELWRYRHLESVGENVEIEFVDSSGSGEYRMTMDPCEKDALARVSGAGSSLSEITGRSTRASRFSNSSGTTCPMPMGGVSASSKEFDSLDRFFRIQRAPQHFPDLAERVSSRIVANQLRFQYRTDFLRATTDTDLVPITIQLRNRDLSFESKQGMHSAVLDLYARITTVGGRVVQTFEEVVSRDIPESLFQSSLDLDSVYQKSVPLRAGLYRLDVAIKDTQSGNIGVLGTALRVPHFDEAKLDASSLILADQIERVPSSQIGAGQFVLNTYKVRPHVSQEFSGSDKLGIYLQLYNLCLDQASRRTRVSVAYRVTENLREVWREVETPDDVSQGGEQLTIHRFIPVSSLSPGHYTIEVTAVDLVTSQTVIRTGDFIVVPAKPGGSVVPQPKF